MVLFKYHYKIVESNATYSYWGKNNDWKVKDEVIESRDFISLLKNTCMFYVG